MAFTHDVSLKTSLRCRLDLLLGHFLVLRGEIRRGCQLADLQLIQHPTKEGHSPCFSVCLTMSNGKTNKYGKKQFGAAMRHKDPRFCTMGALAQYFFFRWHTLGEVCAMLSVLSDLQARHAILLTQACVQLLTLRLLVTSYL